MLCAVREKQRTHTLFLCLIIIFTIFLSLSPFSMDASSIPRYNVFTCIAKTLRILELCLALLLLTWFLTHLPLSGEYLHKLSTFIGSPLFVFAISNAIIAALVAQSGTGHNHSTTVSTSSLSRMAEAEEYHQSKLIMNRPESDTYTGKDYCAETVSDSNLRKVYRRSQSEKSKENGEEGRKTRRRKLRRSETEKVGYPQDKLSNEEFQRTIEAFIAKQMRLLREESVEIFVPEPTNQKLQV